MHATGVKLNQAQKSSLKYDNSVIEQDRTGIVVAAFRMKQQGWPLSDAEAEMQAFGFNDVWVNFKKFIRQYGADLKKQ